jgi:hypothetical protein
MNETQETVLRSIGIVATLFTVYTGVAKTLYGLKPNTHDWHNQDAARRRDDIENILCFGTSLTVAGLAAKTIPAPFHAVIGAAVSAGATLWVATKMVKALTGDGRD